ncbi:type II secretion system protein M [Inquilinus limosus]|uniref:type II secretion system protein GspM n=1 Tax=Inquilinus limosus TaxID=171674 RepID=UPI003F162C87
MASLRLPARWLALALLVALVAIPLAGLGIALSGLWRADVEAAALADTASRFETVAATRPDLAARRDALKAGLGQGERFLGGAGAAISGAELQRLVGDIAARSEAQIDNVLVLPARAEGAYQRIGLRVSLSTRIGPLQRILHALEAGQPSLFVDALQIRAEDREAADPVLSVTFDVTGYRPGGAT